MAVFNSTNLTMAASPSDSDAALARKPALLKLENRAARITATTVNGISNSRVIYRSIIFKDYFPRRLGRLGLRDAVIRAVNRLPRRSRACFRQHRFRQQQILNLIDI